MHNCSPEEKKQGFKDLLSQVRSLMAMNGVSEGGDDNDEFLDPESLVSGGEQKPGEVVAEATVMGEADGDDMDDDESDDFDPSEVAAYFSSREETSRKPIKAARFGGKA